MPLIRTEFIGRIHACRDCPHRKGHECTSAGQLIPTFVNQAGAVCPEGNWPGVETQAEAAPPPTRKRKCCGPKPPGLLQQAKSFARALARETAARLKGDRALAKDVLARRAICKANACGQNVKGRCMACGCVIAAKTAFVTESCPQGHWPTLTRFAEREASAE